MNDIELVALAAIALSGDAPDGQEITDAAQRVLAWTRAVAEADKAFRARGIDPYGLAAQGETGQ